MQEDDAQGFRVRDDTRLGFSFVKLGQPNVNPISLLGLTVCLDLP